MDEVTCSFPAEMATGNEFSEDNQKKALSVACYEDCRQGGYRNSCKSSNGKELPEGFAECAVKARWMQMMELALEEPGIKSQFYTNLGCESLTCHFSMGVNLLNLKFLTIKKKMKIIILQY